MECDVSPEFTHADDKDPLSGVVAAVPAEPSSSSSPRVAVATTSASSSAQSSITECQIIRTPPGLKATLIVQPPLVKDGRPRHTHHLRKPVSKLMPRSMVVSNNHNRPSPQTPTTSTASGSGIPGGTELQQASTMREVLASIPGFNLKTRRRSTKKMSTAAQIAQTHEGCIDLETPDSILVGTNLRALLNSNTISKLPPLYQYKLIQLMPSVDRPNVVNPESLELKPSSLNNEFFARACIEWQNRLAEGEFTPENQLKLKSEAEKEKSKLDPWKLKHFEPIWGAKGVGGVDEKAGPMKVEAAPPEVSSETEPERPSLKTTIKLRPTTSIASSSTATTSSGSLMIKTSSPMKAATASSISPRRVRTVGAVTRASIVQQSPVKLSLEQHFSIKSEVTAADSSQDEEPPMKLEYAVSPSGASSSSLKRPMSVVDEYNEDATASKLLKSDDLDEVDETISVEVTTYDPDDDSSKPKQEESLDSEPYSETSNLVGPYEESLASDPKSMSSSNGELLLQNQNEETLQGTEEIQYIYQNDASCGANEDVAASTSSSSNSNSLNNQINMHDYHQQASSGEEADEPVDDNQIEVISCDNVTNEIISERSGSSDGTQGCSLSVGASIELGHHIKHHQSHLEELGISVSNEEIVTDQETEAADELLPSIQNIPLDDPEQMDEHLTDAVNYVLESEEMMESNETIETDVISPESDKSPNIYQVQKPYNQVGGSVSGHHPVTITQTSSGGTIQSQEALKNVNIEGTTFIVPSDWSYGGTSTKQPRSFQNVRIIQQNEGIVVRESSATPQEQIMQAEIMFEAANTGEVKEEIVDSRSQSQQIVQQQVAPDMEVTSTVISTPNVQSIRSEQICDPSLINTIPVSIQSQQQQQQQHQHQLHHHHQQQTQNVGIVSSGGNIIVAASSPIRTINTSNYSTICIPSSAGVPISTTTVTVPPTKTIQQIPQQQHVIPQNFLIQKQQQHQPVPQAQTISTPVTIVPHPGAIPVQNQMQTTQIIPQPQPAMQQQIPAKMPKQIIYARHPAMTQTQASAEDTMIVPQAPPPPKPKIIMSTASLQPGQQPGTVQTSATIPRAAFAQRVPHQVTRLPVSVGQPQQQQQTQPQPQAQPQFRQVTVKARKLEGGNKGRGGRTTNSGRPPPGAVNLERSYQICQAVIQNSPNRHQLKAQLRPPQEFLAAAAAAKHDKPTNANNVMKPAGNVTIEKAVDQPQTQFSIITSSNKVTRVPLQQKKTTFVQRQQSPNVIVRQVYTTQPAAGNTGPNLVSSTPTQHLQRINLQSLSNVEQQQLGTASIVNNGNGQYVLVQRTGIIQQESGQPRSSSAPPAQNQVHSVNGIPLAITGRGRPASVDTQQVVLSEPQPQHQIVTGPNATSVQTITRRGMNQGIPYSDANADSNLQNYAVTSAGDNSNSSSSTSSSVGIIVTGTGGIAQSCVCSLNAMVICQGCGAFTHEDCLKQKLCVSCVVR